MAHGTVPTTQPHIPPKTDWIDDLLEGWRREYPSLETGALPPMVRLARLAVLIQSFQDEALAPFDLTDGGYSVLAALRRGGEPYAQNPSQLYNLLERSSGGMTKILKRLEGGGLVQRTPDPDDRRGSLVWLTPKGLEVQDRVFRAYLEATDQLFAPLSGARRKETDRVLRQLLNVFEGYFYR